MAEFQILKIIPENSNQESEIPIYNPHLRNHGKSGFGTSELLYTNEKSESKRMNLRIAYLSLRTWKFSTSFWDCRHLGEDFRFRYFEVRIFRFRKPTPRAAILYLAYYGHPGFLNRTP